MLKELGEFKELLFSKEVKESINRYDSDRETYNKLIYLFGKLEGAADGLYRNNLVVSVKQVEVEAD